MSLPWGFGKAITTKMTGLDDWKMMVVQNQGLGAHPNSRIGLQPITNLDGQKGAMHQG